MLYCVIISVRHNASGQKENEKKNGFQNIEHRNGENKARIGKFVRKINVFQN